MKLARAMNAYNDWHAPDSGLQFRPRSRSSEQRRLSRSRSRSFHGTHSTKNGGSSNMSTRSTTQKRKGKDTKTDQGRYSEDTKTDQSSEEAIQAQDDEGFHHVLHFGALRIIIFYLSINS